MLATMGTHVYKIPCETGKMREESKDKPKPPSRQPSPSKKQAEVKDMAEVKNSIKSKLFSQLDKL